MNQLTSLTIQLDSNSLKQLQEFAKSNGRTSEELAEYFIIVGLFQLQYREDYYRQSNKTNE